MKNKRLLIITAVIGSILLLMVIAISAFIWVNYQKTLVEDKPIAQPVAVVPTPTTDPLAPYGILLLGYAGAGHDGGALTDTIIQAVIVPKQERIYLVSIPRDLWITLPFTNETSGEFVQEKVNIAYALGNDQTQYKNRPAIYNGKGAGGLLAMQTITDITNIATKYFLAIDFTGFENAIDQLGGLDVRVTQGFDDPFYPLKGEEDNTCGKTEEEITALTATMSGDKLNQQFGCRYEHIYFDAGTQHMDGSVALKFARSRHSTQSGNDFARAARQQAIIESIENKLLSVSTIPKLLPLISKLSNYVRTNIDPETLAELAKEAEELRKYNVETVVISEANVLKASRSDGGQYILQPKSGENWQLIQDFLNQEMELE